LTYSVLVIGQFW